MFGIDAIAKSVSGIVGGLDDLFTSDHELSEEKTKRKIQDVKALALALQPKLAHLRLAEAQAKHPSIFVAGARPFALWAFVGLVIWNTAAAPLLNWLVGISAWIFGAVDLPGFIFLPTFDLADLGTIVTGILGLAGWRSWDKKNGASRETMTHTPAPPGSQWTPPSGDAG